MSGGVSLATAVGAELGYKVIGRDVIVSAADKLGVSEAALTEKMASGPSLFERLTSNRRLYVTAVQAALAEHVSGGDLVYHGHAGHLLLRELPNVLRVRLIAPMDMRVRAVMEAQHVGREAALDYIRRVDEERVRWTKFIYDVDWRDASLYDMVVSLEKMSVETACGIVVAAVARPEYAVTEATRKATADFILASRVKLSLAMNAQTRDVEFEVTADSGSVKVSGSAPTGGLWTRASTRLEDEAVATIRAVEGVEKMQLDIRKFDAYH